MPVTIPASQANVPSSKASLMNTIPSPLMQKDAESEYLERIYAQFKQAAKNAPKPNFFVKAKTEERLLGFVKDPNPYRELHLSGQNMVDYCSKRLEYFIDNLPAFFGTMFSGLSQTDAESMRAVQEKLRSSLLGLDGGKKIGFELADNLGYASGTINGRNVVMLEKFGQSPVASLDCMLLHEMFHILQSEARASQSLINHESGAALFTAKAIGLLYDNLIPSARDYYKSYFAAYILDESIGGTALASQLINVAGGPTKVIDDITKNLNVDKEVLLACIKMMDSPWHPVSNAIIEYNIAPARMNEYFKKFGLDCPNQDASFYMVADRFLALEDDLIKLADEGGAAGALALAWTVPIGSSISAGQINLLVGWTKANQSRQSELLLEHLKDLELDRGSPWTVNEPVYSYLKPDPSFKLGSNQISIKSILEGKAHPSCEIGVIFDDMASLQMQIGAYSGPLVLPILDFGYSLKYLFDSSKSSKTMNEWLEDYSNDHLEKLAGVFGLLYCVLSDSYPQAKPIIQTINVNKPKVVICASDDLPDIPGGKPPCVYDSKTNRILITSALLNGQNPGLSSADLDRLLVNGLMQKLGWESGTYSVSVKADDSILNLSGLIAYGQAQNSINLYKDFSPYPSSNISSIYPRTFIYNALTMEQPSRHEPDGKRTYFDPIPLLSLLVNGVPSAQINQKILELGKEVLRSNKLAEQTLFDDIETIRIYGPWSITQYYGSSSQYPVPPFDKSDSGYAATASLLAWVFGSSIGGARQDGGSWKMAYEEDALALRLYPLILDYVREMGSGDSLKAQLDMLSYLIDGKVLAEPTRKAFFEQERNKLIAAESINPKILGIEILSSSGLKSPLDLAQFNSPDAVRITLNNGQRYEIWPSHISQIESAPWAGKSAINLLLTPNPAVEQTSFSYFLTHEGPVRVGLYDAQGREVAKLRDELERAGRHDVRIDTTSLASGVYAVIFQAGAQKEVQKLLVVH